MAGRFKALTCAQEPRCSRHDKPAFAACLQGSLSSAIAVPHSDRRRRKAAASPVLALLAASRVFMGTAAAAGVGVAWAPDAAVGAWGTGFTVGAGTDAGSTARRGGEICRCHKSHPNKATPATPATPTAPATQPNHAGRNRRP